jgi:hypothetical protein
MQTENPGWWYSEKGCDMVVEVVVEMWYETTGIVLP